MVCLPVREIIHELKLVDYLHVQTDTQWYNYYIASHRIVKQIVDKIRVYKSKAGAIVETEDRLALENSDFLQFKNMFLFRRK